MKKLIFMLALLVMTMGATAFAEGRQDNGNYGNACCYYSQNGQQGSCCGYDANGSYCCRR